MDGFSSDVDELCSLMAHYMEKSTSETYFSCVISYD